MPYSIMLDAGHGGRDPGAVYNGRQEKDDTLNLVFAIGEILQNNDIDVEYTRTTDVYESPYQKAMEANEAGVDFFISIHRNSFPQDNVVSGVESLVYNKQGIKYEMAQNINAQLETVGFINSDTDNQLFDANFDDIAQAIADGILETLGNPGEEGEMRYSVQVGTFRNRRYAEELLMELQEMEFPARIERGDGFYRVRVGEFETLQEAT